MRFLPRRRRPHLESEMETEMRFHIAQYTEDLLRSGVSAEEARRRALAEFGSIAATRDECREAVGLRFMNELRGDLRYAARVLRQSPVFTVVAVLSLALGIGANTAIFTLMEAALWKSLPVKSPEQLRVLSWTSGKKTVMNSSWGNWEETPQGGVSSTSFSWPVFQELKKSNVVPVIFAFKPAGSVTALVDGRAELVTCHLVSGGFYQGVGVSTVAGRPITPADDSKVGEGRVAVLSYAYWRRRFGGDAAAIGRHIALNQVPVTIIGVNPPEFAGMQPGENPDVFVPITMQPAIIPNQWTKNGSLLDDPDNWWVLIMARLTPALNEQRTLAALDVVLRQAVMASLPVKDRDLPRMRLLTGARGLDDMRDQFGKPLLVLLSLVVLVLLIACANVANLLLARATARQREISMRLALGASRSRISRQLLTEGLLLALVGGVAGILLGYWLRDAIPAILATPWQANGFRAEFDYRVLAIALLVTLTTGGLFSMAPIWQATRVEVNAALKEGTRSTMSLPRLLAGKSLVVFQIALCLLLLVGAGLFARTLSNLRSEKLGFRPERILLFKVDPPRTVYAGERRTALYEELERRIAAIAGVQSSTLSSEPLVANSVSTTQVYPDWRPQRPGMADRAWLNQVGDRFFETMGIPILYGRSLDARDGAKALRVAVVNQRFVREFFPKGDALGRTFHSGKEPYQIVGICGDARFDLIRKEIPPTFYRPYKQASDLVMTFEVKTAATEASIVRAVRETVRSVDRELPVFGIRTQVQQIEDTLSSERLFAALASTFGLLALVLASVGIYGIMAYGVARRTSEIGVRVALGAQSREVLSMILREAAALAVIGLLIGAAAALGLTRFIASMLYGLKPSDPLTLAIAIATMLAVALFAAWWPARKASRLDPMAALRHE